MIDTYYNGHTVWAFSELDDEENIVLSDKKLGNVPRNVITFMGLEDGGHVLSISRSLITQIPLPWIDYRVRQILRFEDGT